MRVVIATIMAAIFISPAWCQTDTPAAASDCPEREFGVECEDPPVPPDGPVFNVPEAVFRDRLQEGLGEVPGLSDEQERMILEEATEALDSADL